LAGLRGADAAAQNDARLFHGPSGLGYAELPEPAAKPAPMHAIDAILAAASVEPGALTLVATGR